MTPLNIGWLIFGSIYLVLTLIDMWTGQYPNERIWNAVVAGIAAVLYMIDIKGNEIMQILGKEKE